MGGEAREPGLLREDMRVDRFEFLVNELIEEILIIGCFVYYFYFDQLSAETVYLVC